MKRTRLGFGFAVVAAISGSIMAGCGDSENFVFTNNSPTVNAQPPVANNDAVKALGNATLQQAAANGVLTNDVLNGATITTYDETSAKGAKVVLKKDGSFEYTPDFGFTGADSFAYTIANSSGESTATVSVAVTGKGIFVNNACAVNGNGSQANPFNNLDDAIGAAATGDKIFVFAGDGSATNQTGTFVLPKGVDLIGQAQGLTVAQTIEPVGNRPVILGTVVPQGDNTIAGFEFNGEPERPAITAENVANLTIENNLFTDLANDNLELVCIGGALTIRDNEFLAVGESLDVIALEQVDTDATILISNNTFVDIAEFDPEDAIDIDVDGASVVQLSVTDNTFTGELQLDIEEREAFDDGLNVTVGGSAEVTLTATGNRFENAIDHSAIEVRSRGAKGLNATISGNHVDGSKDDGVSYDWEPELGQDVFVVRIENNTFDNIVGRDIDIDGESEGLSKGLFFVRNNITSTTDNDASFRFDVKGTATAWLDVFGNRFASDLSLRVRDDGELNVERLDEADGGPLNAAGVNTVGGDLLERGDLTSQPAGSTQAQIP